jgi:hypothetical protein
LPEYIHDSACSIPTILGRYQLDADSGAIPRCEYTNPNRPAVEQIRMSIPNVEDTPNPTAAPLIAAITGFGKSNNRIVIEAVPSPEAIGVAEASI